MVASMAKPTKILRQTINLHVILYNTPGNYLTELAQKQKTTVC